MTNSISNKKIILFDGISGVPMGKEMHEAFVQCGFAADYIDNTQLRKKSFYKLRSAASKVLRKTLYSSEFYYCPQLVQKHFINTLQKHKPDIVLVIGFLYRFINPELLKKLKQQLRFSLILFDTDTCNLFGKRRELLFFLETELPVYDKIFSFSKRSSEFINGIQEVKSTFFPFGAKPIAEPESPEKKFDVCFIGTADMRRIFLLEQIKNSNLAIYGSRWKRYKSVMSKNLQQKIHYNSIWGQDLHRLLHQSKITLNITRSSFYGVETGMNLRLFETLAARSFLLTDYCEELEEIFTIGQEIETYSSSGELIDKVDYYLRHDEKREKIAQKGYELFISKFTWKARVQEMAEQMQQIC
ncbi:MAG: glycosyltransferase [Pseudomonadota bacterium]